ncbi:hypothetical protein [Companilactobacillus suantsaicola]|uniref:hypothetical protein n=1 Tax=Companilactobacillus suantsaicola TaxID=2487723 RepID=UPI0014367506|nr:hypothetical protein [Companilactobacillus suantsaicola]
MENKGNANEVIKDLAGKLANTQVENSILFIENKHLKEENEELKVKLNGNDLHKNK